MATGPGAPRRILDAGKSSSQGFVTLMNLILLLLVAVVLLLLVQGIYVIWTGQSLLFFFSKREYRHAPAKPLRRFVIALGYLSPLGVIVTLMATAINSNDIALLRAFFVNNAGMIFWTSVVALGGILHMVWPAKMLAKTFRERPELAGDRRALLTARLIGACGVLVAIYIFSRL
jgi:hypothetical protein